MDTSSPVPELHVLEPSPVDETPPGFEGEYFPPQPKRGTSSLGLTSHNLPYYLHRAQKYSSIAFTLFTALHVTNTSLIPLASSSPETANRYLLLTRPYYQSFPLETLLIGLPLATHIVSGVALRLYRRRAAVKRYSDSSASRKDRREGRAGIPWPYLSWPSVTGYVAVPLVLGHAALTRGLPLAVEGSSSGIGLDYVGHAVARGPVVGFLGFTALVGVVSAHVVWGIARWAGVTPGAAAASAAGGAGGREGRLARKRRWWVLQAVCAAFGVVWAAGGVGVVSRGGLVGGWVGRGYDRLLGRVPGYGWLLVKSSSA